MKPTNGSISGLNKVEVEQSRVKNGLNSIEHQKKNNLLSSIIEMVKEPMFLLLLTAASIYFITADFANGIFMAVAILLVSAISLIMLAYTNRFLSYAQLVRTLKDQYRENHSAVTAAQIANLRKRLYLTRAMQVTGIGSLLLCVVSMFLMYIQFYLISVYIFGLALVLLIISLGISVREIYISVKALELHLSDMDS